MKHPAESDLALFAGHDLSFVSEWRIGRHVTRCGECRAAVDTFVALRSAVAPLGQLPDDLGWNRLASEMKANIRLGLAAASAWPGIRSGSRAPNRRFPVCKRCSLMRL